MFLKHIVIADIIKLILKEHYVPGTVIKLCMD